ncbi:NAD(P)-bd-dom domain-containing protein [Fusarium falciforme]|uniref:NAD(P)-bd-dom domain-containing protein n=1 Tax=Fusarium falciforme TaxID=195108 RepID=UPI002300ABAC|nr:NAD(P)-bd-dom domain-containing protein [Fusarium falciforme]WAO97225.1 NAD(P)-bd-dom domain-containing protein [Fusarium falciforme]
MPFNATPTYLITAASGNIGRHLIHHLFYNHDKATIVLPTNNPDRLQEQLGSIANNSRVKVVHGNIQEPGFIEATLKSHNVTAAFICLSGENELIVTMNLFDAIKRSGTVKHLVYLSGCGNYDLDAIRAGGIRDNWAGNTLVKHIIEAKLRYGTPPRNQPGGFSWTILGPSQFFSNDYRSKEAMLKNGFFNEPLGNKGVSRVDTRDIALAAANALRDDGQVWGRKKVMIGSLETYTIVDIAKLWSEALGTEITAAKSDEEGLATFEGHFKPFIGPVLARSITLMYKGFDANRFGMNEAEYEDQVALLGKAPASYKEFVKTTAQEWKNGSG